MHTTNNSQLLTCLREAPLFAGLTNDVLRKLLPHMQLVHWPRRMQVMPAAHTAERFYLLTAGRVRIEAEHPDTGRAVTLFLLAPGNGHNLITLLDGKPHNVLAETLDDTQAVYAPLGRWRQWLNDYPPLRQAAMHCAAVRLRELAELAEDLALHDTSARLALLLLRHIDNEHGPHSLLYGLVHEDIAHLIGSVRVVVNRLINRFKQEGVIVTESGHIRIADLSALLNKAERHIQRHS